MRLREGLPVLRGIGWATVVLFLGIAVVYFLAPVLGYRSDRRGALAVSLYLLVAYAGLSVTLLFLQYTKVLDAKAGRGKEDLDVHVLFLFSMAVLGVFSLGIDLRRTGFTGMGRQ